MTYYVLDDAGNPVQEASLEAWGEWMQTNFELRIVAKTTVDDAEVSTVFLAVDHSFMSTAPVLYETMIFGGKHDMFCERHHTRAVAEKVHAIVVAALQAGTDPYEAVSDAG